MLVELLAWGGAALSALLCIPQAVRTLRARQLDGISAATYWIVLANAAIWGAWSLLTGEYAAGVPSLVSGPASLLILGRLLAARRQRARSKDLAGIEDVVRVEGVDRAVQHGSGQLTGEAGELEQTDAVLAGHGAAEVKRAGQDLLEGELGTLLGIGALARRVLKLARRPARTAVLVASR